MALNPRSGFVGRFEVYQRFGYIAIQSALSGVRTLGKRAGIVRIVDTTRAQGCVVSSARQRNPRMTVSRQ